MIANKYRNTNINNVLLISSIILFFVAFINSGLPFMIKIIDKAGNTLNSQFNIAMIFAGLLIAPIFIIIIFNSKPITAFGFYLLMLPFTYRIEKFIAIDAYTRSGSLFTQKISGTTFLLIFIFIVFVARKIPMRKEDGDFIKIEKLLFIFFIIGTLAQVINHNMRSALLLSFGGLWQFMILFYIVSGVLKTNEDAVLLIKYIIFAILVGIVVRIATFKMTAFVVEGTKYLRLGGGAFGSAAHYAGNLTFTIILCLFLIKSSVRSYHKFIYTIVCVIIFIEYLNTFTRGGVIVLSLLLLLPFWETERKYFFKFAAIILLFIPLFGKRLWELISYRGLYFDSRIFSDFSVANRLELFRLGLNEIFKGGLIGYGIGNSPVFSTSIGGSRMWALDNFTLASIFEVGIFPTIIFYYILFYVMKKLIYNIEIRQTSISSLNIYLFLFLLGWFAFANTTSTDIYYYFPYESTMIFYTVLFISVFIIGKNKKTILT